MNLKSSGLTSRPSMTSRLADHLSQTFGQLQELCLELLPQKPEPLLVPVRFQLTEPWVAPQRFRGTRKL